MNIKLTKNIDYLCIVGRTFCLSFAYHMYGSNTGSLSVNLISSNGNQTLFSRNGDAGNSWIVTSISIPPSNGKVHIFLRYLQTDIYYTQLPTSVFTLTKTCHEFLECVSSNFWSAFIAFGSA